MWDTGPISESKEAPLLPVLCKGARRKTNGPGSDGCYGAGPCKGGGEGFITTPRARCPHSVPSSNGHCLGPVSLRQTPPFGNRALPFARNDTPDKLRRG